MRSNINVVLWHGQGEVMPLLMVNWKPLLAVNHLGWPKENGKKEGKKDKKKDRGK